MPRHGWRNAVAAIDTATGAVTPEQQRLAKFAGVRIASGTPQIVASAILRVALAVELGHSVGPVSRWALATLEELRPSGEPDSEPQNDEMAAAWVEYLRLVHRRKCLAKLKLDPGDVVKIANGTLAIVSSIGSDGRVFFAGGGGLRSWPDLLTVIARKDDTSHAARDDRREAQNLAARRTRAATWSSAKEQDLAEFLIETPGSIRDLKELETVIAQASDERPIQRFLEHHPHLLTALLHGHRRYCLPLKRLGSEFVPDFIIGDADSLGVRWVLIELETPRSGIYLKKGFQLDRWARAGVDQIAAWRQWLSENIAYARRRRSEDGLGLFDIHERPPAIVLVGSRSLVPETKEALRREYQLANNVQVHTYDWLVETVGASIQHAGPPITNPYLI